MLTNNFDPVAIQIFSLEIRWYSLAYIVGILLGWVLIYKIVATTLRCFVQGGVVALFQLILLNTVGPCEPLGRTTIKSESFFILAAKLRLVGISFLPSVTIRSITVFAVNSSSN